MGKLSLYHYVLLVSGLLAGLLMLIVSIFMPVNDAYVFSVRSAIEVTQTQLDRLDVIEASVYEVNILVAEDVANITSLHPVNEPVSEEEYEDIIKESSPSSEFDDVTAPTEVETNPVEVSQVHQENEDGEATPTSALADSGSSYDSSSIDSASSAEESIIGDHRFREDRVIINRNRRPTRTNTPVATRTNTPVATRTYTPVATRTYTPVATRTNTPVATRTNTPVPTKTLVPTQKPAENIFWEAGFETGNLSEYSGHGGWIQQGTTPKYEVQSSIVRSGQYAVKFTINTSSMTSQSAYLFYWDTLPKAAYYSAWYYIPSNVDVQHWWNIMQWKSTYNGNSDYSRPVFNLGAGSKQTLGLCYLPDREADKVCWDQGLTLPRDRWFHIETYYDRDKVDGRVIVWQDGVKLFDVSGYPTVLSDGTLHWSVNHYSDDILPNPSSIYLDDIIIAHLPVGH